ncbi:MAG: hypothetical protein ACYDHX_04590 [Methanothrix sp.]
MWIFDSYYKGCVELWGRERGLTKACAAYPPSFYMHLKDPPAHREMIEAHDPDLILRPYADTWVPLMVRKVRRYGLETTFSRTGFFKQMASKSYWSYGKVNHK